MAMLMPKLCINGWQYNCTTFYIENKKSFIIAIYSQYLLTTLSKYQSLVFEQYLFCQDVRMR